MTAVVAVARARIEQGVAAEQRGRVGVREQADVAHGVAGRVEHLELDGLADLDDVAGAKPAIHARRCAAAAFLCASSLAPVAAITAWLPPV